MDCKQIETVSIREAFHMINRELDRIADRKWYLRSIGKSWDNENSKIVKCNLLLHMLDYYGFNYSYNDSITLESTRQDAVEREFFMSNAGSLVWSLIKLALTKSEAIRRVVRVYDKGDTLIECKGEFFRLRASLSSKDLCSPVKEYDYPVLWLNRDGFSIIPPEELPYMVNAKNRLPYTGSAWKGHPLCKHLNNFFGCINGFKKWWLSKWLE